MSKYIMIECSKKTNSLSQITRLIEDWTPNKDLLYGVIMSDEEQGKFDFESVRCFSIRKELKSIASEKRTSISTTGCYYTVSSCIQRRAIDDT